MPRRRPRRRGRPGAPPIALCWWRGGWRGAAASAAPPPPGPVPAARGGVYDPFDPRLFGHLSETDGCPVVDPECQFGIEFADRVVGEIGEGDDGLEYLEL